MKRQAQYDAFLESFTFKTYSLHLREIPADGLSVALFKITKTEE